MECTHTKQKSTWMTPVDDWTGEPETPYLHDEQVSTEVDIDLHRFRCTQCGKVGYYSGAARRFYEEGIPSPGITGLE